MLRHLKLTNFKGFKDAEIPFGDFTPIFGANASGKSNLGDALRFLHGISRGYTLAEIVGGKYVGGSLAWPGIRGGPRGLPFHGTDRFSIEVAIRTENEQPADVTYRIEVAIDAEAVPRVSAERLLIGPDYLYDSAPTQAPPVQDAHDHIKVKVQNPGLGRRRIYEYIDQKPVLGQVPQDRDIETAAVVGIARQVMAELERLRFPQFDLAAMRASAYPSQPLGERGDGLPAVLKALYSQPQIESALNGWLRQLTPMDAVSLSFPVDAAGKIGLQLTEAAGGSTSAESASDGTLLFLGLLATFFSAAAGSFVFLEEPENGIHPARLTLLLSLIEQRVRKQHFQVVATSHSPTLFALLSKEARDAALMVYRLQSQLESRAKRTTEFPNAAGLLATQGPARLLAGNWFENTAEFEADKDKAS